MIPLRYPATAFVVGLTRCGKTAFVCRLLTTREATQPTPQLIILIYSEWQPAHERIKQSLQIGFARHYEPTPLYDSVALAVRNVLVLYDQMDSEGVK
jgi:hypothetical protein